MKQLFKLLSIAVVLLLGTSIYGQNGTYKHRTKVQLKNTSVGSPTDDVVVADPTTGELKTVPQSTVSGSPQTLSLSGQDLSISGGNLVTLPSGEVSPILGEALAFTVTTDIITDITAAGLNRPYYLVQNGDGDDVIVIDTNFTPNNFNLFGDGNDIGVLSFIDDADNIIYDTLQGDSGDGDARFKTYYLDGFIGFGSGNVVAGNEYDFNYFLTSPTSNSTTEATLVLNGASITESISTSGGSYALNTFMQNTTVQLSQQSDVGQYHVSYWHINNANPFNYTFTAGIGPASIVDPETGLVVTSYTYTELVGSGTIEVKKFNLGIGSIIYLTKSGFTSEGSEVLEIVTEFPNTGIRRVGVDPANYAAIGEEAFDISISTLTGNINGAAGTRSFATGTNNRAGGANSLATGISNSVSGIGSIAAGSQNTITSNVSAAFGTNLKAKSFGQVSLGVNGEDVTGNTTAFNPLDRLFNISNGVNFTNLSEALVLLKNGLMTLPSVTNTLIDGAGPDAVPTTGWVLANLGGTTPNLDTVLAEGGTITGNRFTTIGPTSLWQISATGGPQLLLDADGDEIVFGNATNIEFDAKVGGTLIIGDNASTTSIGVAANSTVSIGGQTVFIQPNGTTVSTIGHVLTAIGTTGQSAWQAPAPPTPSGFIALTTPSGSTGSVNYRDNGSMVHIQFVSYSQGSAVTNVNLPVAIRPAQGVKGYTEFVGWDNDNVSEPFVILIQGSGDLTFSGYLTDPSPSVTVTTDIYYMK